MIVIKCMYADGDTTTTKFNGTYKEAVAYYVGQTFNIGSVEDNTQRCDSIELLADESLTDEQRSLLTSFADHPRIWDAAHLFAIVCQLHDAGYVAFIGDGPLAEITDAGRALL